MIVWAMMTALSGSGQPPGPDGELFFHHSELVRIRTVSATHPGAKTPVRCAFELRIDVGGVPRPDVVERHLRGVRGCDDASFAAAREALLQWRFAPSWVRDRYIPARTIIALTVSDSPREIWELPVYEQVCTLVD